MDRRSRYKVCDRVHMGWGRGKWGWEAGVGATVVIIIVINLRRNWRGAPGGADLAERTWRGATGGALLAKAPMAINRY